MIKIILCSLLAIIMLPCAGIISYAFFYGFSWLISLILCNIFKIVPEHYKYTNFTKLSNCVNQQDRFLGKYLNAFNKEANWANGYNPSLKTKVIAYLCLSFIGLISIIIFRLVNNFILSHHIKFLIEIDENGELVVSTLVFLLIYSFLTVFYYILDYLSTIPLFQGNESYIQKKLNEERAKDYLPQYLKTKDYESILNYFGIETEKYNKQNLYIVSHYEAPVTYKYHCTYEDVGINEQEMFNNIVAIREFASFENSDIKYIKNLKLVNGNVYLYNSFLTEEDFKNVKVTGNFIKNKRA